ncbi:NADP-dependent oxidoreductase [Flaviaesturariibacter aridisoli]|uniref:NADP-dependent oxidoreductase n=1 Tax=Flaviaesturariibacter aridisoli TaxID=2545761 RepID=A0A4V2WN05_9BACT|nr:NADP-dependent oxidoreductase [Flaviaesturariibacter aridisoli]TCZ73732.1 NADP-dependent oxidoreductase [Flaviaesturariibacter aridisoli]
MKAYVLNAAGGTDVLQLTDVRQPRPAAGDVLLRNEAISINPVDIKTRKGGAFFNKLMEAPPVILGWDVAGTVEAVGEGVTQWKVGDRLFGMVNFPGAGRAYAEYVTAPATHFARIPDGISTEEAAATTLAALTAWQVLVHRGGLRAGQRVLIHAAAGGVGHFAVQIAKQVGAEVIGTASAANHDYLRRLGASEVIDYHNDDFRKLASDIDLVLDPVGGDTALHSLDVLRPGGVLVSIVGGAREPVAQEAERRCLRAENYLVQSSGPDMEDLARLLEAGHLKATIGHRFSFAEMAAAHAQVETGHTRGKVVLSL